MADLTGMLIENYYPPIQSEGIKTNKSISIGGSAGFDMSASSGTFKTPTGAFTQGGDFTVASGKTLAVTTTDKLTVGGIIVPQYVVVTYNGQTASATDATIFIAARAYQVVDVSEVHSVAAGGTSTLQLTKDTSTNAPGAGTDLLTSTGFNLNATANTVQNGTLTSTTADLQLAAGDRLGLDFANAIQSSATVSVTVSLKRI
jgi:hypothetical protein